MKFIRQEPALVMGVLQSSVALLLAFGVKLTLNQTGAIMAVLASLMSLVTRSMVTPIK